MSIDSQLFVNKFPVIAGALVLLIGGKTLLVTGVGRFFGLSTVAAARAGLLLAPGGEFAFVAFGEAVNQASFHLIGVNFTSKIECSLLPLLYFEPGSSETSISVHLYSIVICVIFCRC